MVANTATPVLYTLILWLNALPHPQEIFHAGGQVFCTGALVGGIHLSVGQKKLSMRGHCVGITSLSQNLLVATVPFHNLILLCREREKENNVYTLMFFTVASLQDH